MIRNNCRTRCRPTDLDSVQMSKPNILFILTDQQTATSLGCYGNTICRTPHVDWLASQGTRFDNAYCCTPICSPARASMQTGLFPHKHGIQSNIYTRGSMVHELPDHPTLLSRKLISQGYRIGYTGKWHMGFGDCRRSHPEYHDHIKAAPVLDRVELKGSVPSSLGYEGDDFPGHGGIGMDTPQYQEYLAANGLECRKKIVFDRYPQTFEVTSGTRTTVSHFLVENAMEHIRSFGTASQPWFYMLNFWGPHSPYHASSEFLDLYRHVSMPKWASFDESQDEKPNIHNAHRTETTSRWTWDEYETITRHYYASITEIDAKIGLLLEMLRNSGQLDSTVILFSSDHGDSLGTHRGLTDKALFMYDEITRIPVIVRPPGGTQIAESDDRFIGTCDLYSTILDYSGISTPDWETDGQSFRPIVEGQPVSWRESIVTESVGIDFLLFTQRSLRFREYKYIFNAGDTDEMYNLAADPAEMRNLIDEPEYQATVLELRMKLDEWMGRYNDGLRERYRRLRLRHLF